LKKLFSLFIISFLVFKLQGQAVRTPVAARYVGLGAYSINHVDVFSFTSNQAVLARIKNISAGIYGEKRFLLAAVNLYSAVLALPTQHGNFGIEADYFGFKNYNESQLGVAYARSLGSKLDIGIKFNYYTFRVPRYANATALDFELGVITHLTDKLHAGIHVYNPAGGKFSKLENEKLSSAYKFGMGYDASERFLVSTEIIKEEEKPVNVNAGFQYNFMKQFFVRAGIATETTNSYAGAGIKWKSLRLDFTGSYHPQLGFTPGLLVIADIKNEKE
jgi:hypothetical protein